jgi:tetratricopeptide (TPR) repeat protein
MAAHPSQALLLELKKSCFFWSNYEVHDIDSTYKNYVTIQSWPLLPFGAIATLGIMGMMIFIRRCKDIMLLYWMILIYFASVLIFFTASRYRLPAVPFLSIFAASALRYLCLQIRDKKWNICGVCLGIVLVLAAGTKFPFRDDIEKFDRWQQATRIHYSLGGSMFFRKGEYREAIREFQKALALDPTFVAAYNHLGKSYAILNEYGQAEEAFKKVIQLAPEVDEGYMNLGILYELRGDIPQAAGYLKRALAINPRNEKAKSHLQVLTAPQGRH